MKWDNRMKSLLILVMSSLLLFGFAQYGASAYQSFLNKGIFKKETMIASLSIEGMTYEEALDSLKKETQKWHEETTIIVRHDHEAIIDNTIFQFQLEETLQEMNDTPERNVIVTIDEEKLKSFLLQEFSNTGQVNAINLKQLLFDMKSLAENYEKGIYTYDLMNYLQIDKLPKTIISEATVAFDGGPVFTEGEASVLISPQQVFSLEEFLTKFKLLDIDDKTASKLATALYQALLTTPLEVLERHISTELPDYAELGMEAAFKKDEWDFTFYNPEEQVFDLYFYSSGQKLTVQIKGAQLKEYRLVKQNETTYPTRTIIQYDPKLYTDQEKVKNSGKDGSSVAVIKQVYLHGQLESELFVSEDYYPPVFKTVVKGLKEVVQPEDSQLNEPNQPIPPKQSTNNTGTTQPSQENQESSSSGVQEEEIWETPKVIK